MTTTILKNCIEVAKATENTYMVNQLTKVLEELNSTEHAKKVLEYAGYYTDNLWHVNDVLNYHDCTDDEALEILDNVLTNDWIIEQINENIKNEYND